jgi:8-oxo-dGTP pyrophosphatase MutT (NUDIX family)
MHSDVHARVHAFLQDVSVVPLFSGSPQGRILKAGVVPFVRSGGYRFYLMKPVARHANLVAPSFQLCKGTRMHRSDGQWRDLHEDDTKTGEQESLAATALREGIEELGLKLENITSLFELGGYMFSSAKSGNKRQMWLFAAEMKNEADFLPDAQVASTTAARQWLTLAEFDKIGREDHRPILHDIAAKLETSH